VSQVIDEAFDCIVMDRCAAGTVAAQVHRYRPLEVREVRLLGRKKRMIASPAVDK